MTKKIKLNLDYNFNYSFYNQNKTAKNLSKGEYVLVDPIFTNSFENQKIINRLGLKFIYETKKQTFQIGSRARNIQVRNVNRVTNQVIHQPINNILPFSNYTYKFSQNNKLDFRYSTDSRQPTIDQLQPIRNNVNTNNIDVGNPNLLPTFSNKLDVNYYLYKPLSEKYLSINSFINYTNNDFSNSVKYDSLGRTISQSINVNGNYYSYLGVHGQIPVLLKKLFISPNAFANYSNRSNFINEQKNTTQQLSSNLGVDLAVDLDTLNFSIKYNYQYVRSNSSLSSASNLPTNNHTIGGTFAMKLPFKMLFETDAQYIINSKRFDGYNLKYLVWNANISKSFLKTENLIVSFNAYDILKQNINNIRMTYGNIITDEKTNIITRYFLLKVIYKFNNTKTKESDDMY